MFDVIVIGGSFAGVSAALQLGRARRKVLLVDSASTRNRFALSAHGFFGHDGKPPRQLQQEGLAQLAAYSTVTIVNALALAARAADGVFEVTIGDGRIERAARLILATGIRDELPCLPGLRERWGRSVVHCPYCHGYELAPGPFGVLATSPASAHQAMMVPDWGPTTYFTQGEHEPDEALGAQLAARGVQVERWPVVELLGAAPELQAVRLADGRVLPLAGLFVAPQLRMTTPIVSQLGCAMEEGPLGAVVKADEMKQTSVPGVFAAGDVSALFGNAVFAAAAGAMAGVAAHRSLVFGI
jgi:thioredoxin reductase